MQFLSTVCIAALVTALFRLLVPENKFKNQIGGLLAGIFLLTGISAARNLELDLDTDYIKIGSDYSGFSGNVTENLKKKICDEMSDKLYGIFHENGIYPDEIHIIVNISGLYSINITGVKVVLGAEQRAAAEAAAELLRAELPGNIKTEVSVKE